ncbi:MAG: outer membrane protein assembly factor BamD [Burkholderiales bacterium]|nr:outer membrane protein assembly factor BamD [Burkholderiales bacterium]
MSSSKKTAIFLVIISLLLVACSDSNDPIREETKNWSVQKLYNVSSNTLNNHNYSKAIKYYQVLETTYPYGIYAQQGLLDLAYAYYENDQADMAIPVIDQFISLYPTNSNIDYALYLKGYINYKNDNGLLSKYTGQDLSERDPQNLIEAYKAFNELVTKYPKSSYTPDAKDKINRLINAMARGEIYRARYYMTVKAYLAAISRSQNVITLYPNSPWVEEAIAIEILAYKKLGKMDLSQLMYNTMVLNFPHSEYLKHQWVNQDIPWYAFWR